VIAPALRDLLAVAAETADVPHPANWEDRDTYARTMGVRLNSLHVILSSLSREPRDYEWNARQIRGQAGLLREWLEQSPVTYEPYVRDSDGTEITGTPV
jgi:hypothetical protein